MSVGYALRKRSNPPGRSQPCGAFGVLGRGSAPTLQLSLTLPHLRTLYFSFRFFSAARFPGTKLIRRAQHLRLVALQPVFPAKNLQCRYSRYSSQSTRPLCPACPYRPYFTPKDRNAKRRRNNFDHVPTPCFRPPTADAHFIVEPYIFLWMSSKYLESSDPQSPVPPGRKKPANAPSPDDQTHRTRLTLAILGSVASPASTHY